MWPYGTSESGIGSQAWKNEKQNFHLIIACFEESLEQNSFIS